ncbi:MAG: hypothetical protein V1918_00025, partial [Planctomycetota bacterium]
DDIILISDRVLKKNKAAPAPCSPGGEAESTQLPLFRFAEPWSFSEALEAAQEAFRRLGVIAWTSPASFQGVLALYAEASPEMAAHLKKQGFEQMSSWDGGPWREGLVAHARAMAAYGESAARIGIPPQKYIGLGYAPVLSRAARGVRAIRRILRGGLFAGRPAGKWKEPLRRL